MAWSAAKNYIFQSFKYALGAGRIKGVNYSNLKVNLTDSNFFAANSGRIMGVHYSKEVNAESLKDYNKLTLGDLKTQYKFKGYNNKIKGIYSNIIPTNKYLFNVNVDSFNNDTGMTNPDSTYELIDDMPCSSRIFSNQNDGSWITKDFDWSVDARKKPSIMNYFAHEYNFSNKYDKTEYITYGISENILDENVIRISAESFINDDPNNKIKNDYGDETEIGVMSYGAAGVLLTYEDEFRGFTGDNELPVAYYDFGNTLHSNYNYIKLDWHEDGVIKVE